jgi:phosphate/sulfate permease
VSDPADSLTATVDFVLSFVGVALLVFPVVWSVGALLGLGSSSAVGLVTGVVAFGAAYPLVAGDWSRDTLGEAVFVFVGSVLLLGVVAVVVTATSGWQVAGSDPRPQILLFAGGYLLTAGVVTVRRR